MYSIDLFDGSRQEKTETDFKRQTIRTGFDVLPVGHDSRMQSVHVLRYLNLKIELNKKKIIIKTNNTGKNIYKSRTRT
jgi:hypothetical protein